MNNFALFASVALAHLLAAMSPGPDFAVVTRQTLRHGRAAGVWTAWGIATGIIFHVAYGLFGLAWLLEKFPQLLEWLRYAGAAFLIWMGVQALRPKPVPSTAATSTASAQRHYAIGIATNLFNPKVTLFFVALFSAVITTSTPTGLRLALAAWIVLSTGAWFSFVALSLGAPAMRARLLRHAGLLDRTMGVILLALGVGMLLGDLL